MKSIKTELLGQEPDRDGAVAFFLSKPCIGCVRVNNIVVNDWGVSLTVTRVPVPGFGLAGWQRGESHDVSGSKEIFSAYHGEWSAYSYGGWELHFDPAVVAEMTEFAAQAAARGEALDYYATRALIEPIASQRRERRNAARTAAPPPTRNS